MENKEKLKVQFLRELNDLLLKYNAHIEAEDYMRDEKTNGNGKTDVHISVWVNGRDGIFLGQCYKPHVMEPD